MQHQQHLHSQQRNKVKRGNSFSVVAAAAIATATDLILDHFTGKRLVFFSFVIFAKTLTSEAVALARVNVFLTQSAVWSI